MKVIKLAKYESWIEDNLDSLYKDKALRARFGIGYHMVHTG